MGCTNSKVGPEPTVSSNHAWTEAKPRRTGWRRLASRLAVPACGGTTKVEPIGVIPPLCTEAARAHFNKPANNPFEVLAEAASTETAKPALSDGQEEWVTSDQPGPDTAPPSRQAEVIGVVDLEVEQTGANPVQYFTSRPESPFVARPLVKRAWRERPPSRGGIQLELALYGQNATRPFPSCLGRAVLENNFRDKKLRNDVKRAQKLHLETQLGSVRSHDGKKRAKVQKPSVVQSCLNAFMEYESKSPRTKLGRRLHRVCESPVSENPKLESKDNIDRSLPLDSRCNECTESQDRGDFDFYF